MGDGDFIPAIDDAQVPDGSMKAVNLAGRNILLAKVKGQVFGVGNRCPHMGCSLANGSLKDYLVTCPCHGWSFDVRDGVYQRAKSIQLITFDCKIENGKIFVKILDDI